MLIDFEYLTVMSILKAEMIKYYQEIYHGLQKNHNLSQVSEHVIYSIVC